VVPNVVMITSNRNQYPSVEGIRHNFPTHDLHHYNMRSFLQIDYSHCFSHTDLLWFELPHRWLPKQLVPSNLMFDAIMRFQRKPIIFVLHKPISSPLIRNSWFKECMGTLKLSKCCTCCYGSSTHCLIFLFTRGVNCKDRICQKLTPVSIVSINEEAKVWKRFVANWLQVHLTFMYSVSGDPEPIIDCPPGLEFMSMQIRSRVSPNVECSDSIVGEIPPVNICLAHNPVTEQPYGSGCSGYENKVGTSLWAQQVPDSPLVTDGTQIKNCGRQQPPQQTRSSKHANPDVTDKSIPGPSHDSYEVIEEGRIYKL
jgi:hypothetical protein